MKKAVKVSFMVVASVLILIFCLFVYYFISTFDTNLDTNKLVSFERSVVFYDINNNQVLEQSNGNSIVNIAEIPEHAKNAFISQYINNEKVDKDIMNLSAEFCVSGLIKIYKLWFEKDCNVTQDQLAKLVGTLVWGGMQAVLEETL